MWKLFFININLLVRLFIDQKSNGVGERTADIEESWNMCCSKERNKMLDSKGFW